MKKIILLACISLFPAWITAAESDYAEWNKLGEAAIKINTFYVDSVDTHDLVENAIVGMLTELDPHSVYIPSEEVSKANEPLVGNFEGIGVQFQIIDDTLHVEQTIVGGPSEKVGILPGDRIVMVNDSTIAGVKMSTSDIMKRLRGKKGTIVNVKILRRGVDELIEFKIERDKIPLYSIDTYYMVDDSTGYIKLSKFSASTKKEFNDALQSLKEKGMQNLILDLQTNGGGYLGAAIALADEFLLNSQLIVYTESRGFPNKTRRIDHKASYTGNFEKGKLLLLVNEYSASASEILSGAVQDWDRGLIIGRRTFGKGLVQQDISIADGSKIRLTVARYFTPSGRSIQKPYKDGITKYRHDVVERYNRGELIHEDSIHFPDSLRRETLTLKRTVYGGGGIMPDYFVPLDTAFSSSYLTKLIAKGILTSSTAKFVEKNEKTLMQQYPTFDKFQQEFTIPDSLLQQMIKTAEDDKLPFDSAGYSRSKRFMTTQMKGLVARRLWGMPEFYKIFNTENEAYLKALEIIADPKMYNAILKRKK